MTVQDIYDRAVERSNLNDAALVGQAEWVNFISTAEQSLYLEAAEYNPDFFGKEGVTASRSSGGSWNLRSAPSNVTAVSQVEIDTITGTVSGLSAGDRVNMISIRDPEAELSPRAYLRDLVIREYNDELSTDASNYVSRLKIFYSFLPSTRTDPEDELDLPDQWSPLLVLPLARILAIRDQRPDEVGPLDQEFILHRGIFLRHLGVADEVVVRELEAVAASSPQLVTNE
jgi:hypothetical protein